MKILFEEVTPFVAGLEGSVWLSHMPIGDVHAFSEPDPIAPISGQFACDSWTGMPIPATHTQRLAILCEYCKTSTVWLMEPTRYTPQFVICFGCHQQTKLCDVVNMPGLDDGCVYCNKRFLCASIKPYMRVV